jgi:hypothetical protein
MEDEVEYILAKEKATVKGAVMTGVRCKHQGSRREGEEAVYFHFLQDDPTACPTCGTVFEMTYDLDTKKWDINGLVPADLKAIDVSFTVEKAE